ncbi:hypothetical protein GCM10009827_101680 [Dactylosporangium maewongense]|uniref:Uncharacterized protein n=1 Tax=Dactylosporangium maewongense TaxID=634393 RepID=A0ABP4NPJ1_9ACTN
MTGRPVLTGPLRDLLASYDAAVQTSLGQSVAADIDFTALDPLLHHDLEAPGPETSQTLLLQRLAQHIVSVVADLVRAPSRSWTGTVHAGMSAATAHVLAQVRATHPGLVVYLTQTGHDHVRHAATLLGLPVQVVRYGADGAMNLLHLTSTLRRNATAPALVVASVGTPATEAVDDVVEVRAATATHRAAVHIHVDSLIAGWHRALLDRDVAARPAFDCADGADSVVLGGRFLGTPQPSAIALYRTRPGAPDDAHADALRVGVGTEFPARGPAIGADGEAAVVQLWHAIHVAGVDGHALRARRARALARYTLRRLQEAGWPAWAHPDALTVLLRPPSPSLRQRWSLPVDGDWARIVCMPGRTEAHIDQFLTELARDQPTRTDATTRPVNRPGRADLRSTTGTPATT